MSELADEFNPRPSWADVILRGHKTFPVAPWRADGRWRPDARSFSVLVLGLAIFGFGEGLIYAAAIGNSPWTVLAEGIMLQSGLPLGLVTALISLSVLMLWIPLRERPGIGTLMNVVIIAATLDVTAATIATPDSYIERFLLAVVGVLLVGVASAFYLTTNLGPGPRQGLLTSLHERTGVRVSRVSFGIEVVVLSVGFLLGGTVGVGTVLFAAGIGRAIAFGLGLIARLAPTNSN